MTKQIIRQLQLQQTHLCAPLTPRTSRPSMNWCQKSHTLSLDLVAAPPLVMGLQHKTLSTVTLSQVLQVQLMGIITPLALHHREHMVDTQHPDPDQQELQAAILQVLAGILTRHRGIPPQGHHMHLDILALVRVLVLRDTMGLHQVLILQVPSMDSTLLVLLQVRAAFPTLNMEHLHSSNNSSSRKHLHNWHRSNQHLMTPFRE